VQVVVALVVTPEGFPLTYEVMAGNTADKTTLRGFLAKIEKLYGKAERVWVMDRGIPTEEVLAEMRASDPPVHYLVGTPKGRLSQYEAQLLEQPWQSVRAGVQVKLLAQAGELYVLAQSKDRVGKERSMRQRQLKGLVALTHSFCYRVGTVASVECYPKKATHEYCQQNCSEGNCGGITSSV
jgi:transposase